MVVTKSTNVAQKPARLKHARALRRAWDTTVPWSRTHLFAKANACVNPDFTEIFSTNVFLKKIVVSSTIESIFNILWCFYIVCLVVLFLILNFYIIYRKMPRSAWILLMPPTLWQCLRHSRHTKSRQLPRKDHNVYWKVLLWKRICSW